MSLRFPFSSHSFGWPLSKQAVILFRKMCVRHGWNVLNMYGLYGIHVYGWLCFGKTSGIHSFNEQNTSIAITLPTIPIKNEKWCSKCTTTTTTMKPNYMELKLYTFSRIEHLHHQCLYCGQYDVGYETLHCHIWYELTEAAETSQWKLFHFFFIFFIYMHLFNGIELHCHITLCVTISFINYRKFSYKFKQLHIQIYYQNFANHEQLYPGTISKLRLQILICKWLVFALVCCVFVFCFALMVLNWKCKWAREHDSVL